ncbi:XRE family transcriptional regulator [Clostridium tetani]|nr:XRE family transcriptional regulator [Clostridium tetani]QBD87668.1 XRE family transcriptional regulator [Clostridium tetani]
MTYIPVGYNIFYKNTLIEYVVYKGDFKMFDANIKRIREQKGLGVNELSRISGVNASYISALERGEKQNPTITILKKLANALEVTIDELMKSEPINYDKLADWDDKHHCSFKEDYFDGEFKTAESAMQFILNQPVIMGFGGFDVNKMSDDEIVEFGNDLLGVLKTLSSKYNK